MLGSDSTSIARFCLRGALALVAPAVVLLLPGDAEACSTGEEFERTLTDTFPLDGATDVPLDGVLLFTGHNLGGELRVEVSLDGTIVPGVVDSLGPRQLWLADAPLEPESVYEVHAWTEAIGENVDAYLTFTTGTELAPAVQPPEIVELSVGTYEKVYTKCVAQSEPGDCDDCAEEEVTKTEQRIRLTVRLATPPSGPFDRYYRGSIRHGVDAQAVAEGAAHETDWWIDAGDPMTLTDDLGLVGTWEGTEVCVRAENRDPLDNGSEPIVACVDIGDANTPIPDDDTGGEETDGDTGADTGSDVEPDGADTGVPSDEDTDGPTDAGPRSNAEDAGCACQASPSTPAGAASFLGLCLLWARRRR
jgi:MYXO-CTERM domain-containing protein